MSEIKCLVCKGNHFHTGYYEIDVNVDIYSTAYNNVEVSNRSFDNAHIDVDVYTSIDNETIEKADISLRLKSEENKDYYRFDKYADVFKYICEECGFIMSFTKEKNIESKFEEKKRQQKEKSYDWSDFGE